MATSSSHLNQNQDPVDSAPFGTREKAITLWLSAAVDPGELKPETEAVKRYFGGSRYSADSETKEKICAAISQACRIVSPLMTIAINPIKPLVQERTLKLPGGLTLPLPDCAGDLSVRYLAAAIGTLGKGLETECRHLAAQQRIYQSTLLDAVGTAMLETMDTEIRTRIDTESHPLGLCSGVRFAPGLNGYPMDHQKTLFELADGFSMAVRLNADFMMEPVKTISFFILLVRPDEESRQPEKCSRCRSQLRLSHQGEGGYLFSESRTHGQGRCGGSPALPRRWPVLLKPPELSDRSSMKWTAPYCQDAIRVIHEAGRASFFICGDCAKVAEGLIP
ncbi:MAG: hypothetical protein V1844_00310 [Pseudomonadota bacterium]